jgi:hypothetical protein
LLLGFRSFCLSGGRKLFLFGLVGMFCLAFAVFCLSGGGEFFFVEPVALIFLFRVGLAQFLLELINWAFEVTT